MKKAILILITITLLLFAGCSSGGSNTKQNSFELTSSFNGGDGAITLEFGEEAPPDKVRDQELQPFVVRLLLRNTGEYEIPENSAYVTLTGFNPADLNLADNSKPLVSMRGYKKQGDNVIEGGTQIVTFDNLKYINSVVSGSVPMTIYANVCYPYETKAFAVMCINGDTIPALDKRAEICELEGDKEFANSGGPVKIDNVKQYPFGQHSVQLQFDIIHTPTSEDANVYERNSIDSDCKINGASPSGSEALFKRDKVTYTVETGIAGLNCESTNSGTNTVTLTGDKYTVTCIQDTENQEEYPKPITITLKYDYLDRISKTINIEHIDR